MPEPKSSRPSPAAKPGNPSANESQAAGEHTVRSKIIKRLLVATLLVVILLGLLVWVDDRGQVEVQDPPVFTQPVPVQPKPIMASGAASAPAVAPALPTESLPADPLVTTGSQDSMVAAPSAQAPAPVTIREPQPVAPAPVVAGAPPVTSPAKGPPVEPVPEFTAPPERPSSPVRRQVSPPEIEPEASQAMAGKAPLAFQAGNFLTAKRAEALRARLKRNGIPATLETRVRLGPFKTQKEADAARAKAKALGIELTPLP